MSRRPSNLPPDSATAIFQAYSKGKVIAEKQENGFYTFQWIVPEVRNGSSGPGLYEIKIKIDDSSSDKIAYYSAICGSLEISSGCLDVQNLGTLEDTLVFEWNRPSLDSIAMRLESVRALSKDDENNVPKKAVFVDAIALLRTELDRTQKKLAEAKAVVIEETPEYKRLDRQHQKLKQEYDTVIGEYQQVTFQQNQLKAELEQLKRQRTIGQELIPDPDAEFTERDFLYLINQDGMRQTNINILISIFKAKNILPQRHIPGRDTTQKRAVYSFSQIDPKLEDICQSIKVNYYNREITPQRVRSEFTYIDELQSTRRVTLRYLAFRFRMTQSGMKHLLDRNNLQPEVYNLYSLAKVAEIINKPKDRRYRWADSELKRPQPVYKK